MFVVRRRKFFCGFGQSVNRLLGEVGGGVRDLEALPLNFPVPVCSHFLTPFLFIFYTIIEPVQFTAMFCKAFFLFKLRVFTSCRAVNFQPNHDGT